MLKLIGGRTAALDRVVEAVAALGGRGGIGLPGGATAAAYFRVSTEEQTLEDRSGLDRQVQRVHEAARAAGHFIPADLIWAEDHTATTMNRPALLDLLSSAGAVAKRASCVWFEDMDRLGRAGAWEAGWVLHQLRQAGLEPRFASHSNDDISAFLYAWKAKEDNERRRLFIRHANLKKAREGKITARSPKYGYRINRQTKQYEVDDCQAEVVRNIFRWYAVDGLSLRAISARLHGPKDGPPLIPSPTGRDWWPVATIRKMLTDESYIAGVFYANRWVEEGNKRTERPKSEWLAVPVPRIIEPDLAEATARRLAEARDEKWNPRNSVKREWLLQGLLFCTCGRRFSPTTYREKRGRQQDRCQYRCTSAASSIPKQRFCKSSVISKNKIETRVWEIVERLVLTPEALLAAAVPDETMESQARDLNRVLAEEAKLGRAWGKLWQAYQEEVIDKAMFDRESRRLTEQRRACQARAQELQAQLAALRDGRARQADAVQQLKVHAEEVLAGLDYAGKRRLLRQLFDEIVLDTQQETLTFRGCVVGVVTLKGDAMPIILTPALPSATG